MNIELLTKEIENELTKDFSSIDEIALFNQEKVLSAFNKHRLSQMHFYQTNGYGYGDIGRDTLGKVYASIFGAEDGLVSPHILSGTHAISTALFGILRPNDTLVSICGAPYDTLVDIISKKNTGSLYDFGVRYQQIELINGEFDLDSIAKSLENKPKMVFIQRSRGYSDRNPFSVATIANIVKFIRSKDSEVVIFCDNCYGEFTEMREPTEVGVDIAVGSLIKNIGGGIAPNGGYIVGKKSLIELCANRLTTPSTGAEIGSYMGGYQYFYQGLFLAPHITAQSLKGALFLGEMMKKIGFDLVPQKRADCYDIIRSIKFKNKEQLIKFVREIQKNSPVDSFVVPYEWDMPGYNDQIIMAAGCFVQGSSIELSCDAPIREPYIAYCQGGLTYEHIKIATINSALALMKKI